MAFPFFFFKSRRRKVNSEHWDGEEARRSGVERGWDLLGFLRKVERKGEQRGGGGEESSERKREGVGSISISITTLFWIRLSSVRDRAWCSSITTTQRFKRCDWRSKSSLTQKVPRIIQEPISPKMRKKDSRSYPIVSWIHRINRLHLAVFLSRLEYLDTIDKYAHRLQTDWSIGFTYMYTIFYSSSAFRFTHVPQY